MTSRAFGFFGITAALLFAAACGGSVEVTGQGVGGSGGAGGSGGCAGAGPMCGDCGSDAFESALCQNGAWACPPGTVDVNDCPAGTCWGPPLPCEVCADGWSCSPSAACIGSCESFVCATCVGAPPGLLQLGGCTCSCNGSEYGCALAPGCCNTDLDCGDETFFPCVNNVCKQPVMGGCWADVECGAGMKCEGAFVCPCNFDCNGIDTPGTCVPL